MSDSHRNHRQPAGLIFCAFFTFISLACAGTYSGGSGTAEDPYRISTVADWQELAITDSDWDKHFILINDIDFGGISLMPVGIGYRDANQNIIYKPFTGVFSGNDHVIRNAAIDMPSQFYVGLFGCLGNGGTIQNLRVEDISVTGQSVLAVLCGYNSNGSILACHAAGSVVGNEIAGILCGWNAYGQITNCTASGIVSGIGYRPSQMGGICGGNGGTIRDCHATGTINGGQSSRQLGGLVGANGGTILTSSADCRVTGLHLSESGGLCGGNYGTIMTSSAAVTFETEGNAYRLGGLCGYNSENISDCFASCTSRNNFQISEAGGLCGTNWGGLNNCYSAADIKGRDTLGCLCGFNLDVIFNCHATGTIQGSMKIGGICGENQGGRIVYCYSIGKVSGSSWVGGLCGQNDNGQIVWSFWDIETSGMANSDGGTGATTAEMKTLPLYRDNYWDFTDLWWMPQDDYPRLFMHLPNHPPATPILIGPEDGTPGMILTPALEASAFSDPDGDLHAVSQWQVDDNSDFSSPEWDSGVVSFGVSKATVPPQKLCYNTTYYWRVRHKDDHTTFSDWSASRTFITLDGYSGGRGTAEAPCQISTVSDWQELVTKSGDWNKHFILLNDIDFGGIQLTPIAPDTDSSTPEFQGITFTGDFNGNGHTLRNSVLYYPDLECIGLFGCIGSNGDVHHVFIEDIETVGRNFVGCLSGILLLGDLTYCSVQGEVLGLGDSVGGLVGANHSGSIDFCDWAGPVEGNDCVGGIAGWSWASYTFCSVTGTVTGNQAVGGISGYHVSSNMQSCAVNGRIQGNTNIGGLAGYNFEGYTAFCYVTGNVVGSPDSQSVGGLIGFNEGKVVSCYTRGKVSGTRNIGGLVGHNNAILQWCYSIGPVTGESCVGGLVGYTDKFDTDLYIFSCFWDIETSGQAVSAGGTGKRTPEMMDPFTFVEWGHEWRIQGGRDYPHLDWEETGAGVICPYSGGSGTADDPYRIASIDDWRWLMRRTPDWGQSFVLMTDLDFDGARLIPIARDREEDEGFQGTPFTGVFNGLRHLVRNGAIEEPTGYSVGLFGRIGPGGIVKNLRVEDISVSGYQEVGGLAGCVDHSTLSACSVSSPVSALNGLCGGLAGRNVEGTIFACRSAGAVQSQFGRGTGGLVGDHYNATTDCCYATGTVWGGEAVGGLIGSAYRGSIHDCYSIGWVSGKSGATQLGGLVGYSSIVINVTACFWDTKASGQGTSACGTGKTTAEMKAYSTYVQLTGHWDVVGESDEGRFDIWRIHYYTIDYPRLSWESGRYGDFCWPDGVDYMDLWYLAGRWMAGTPATVGAADANGDGKADMVDLAIVSENWMK
jgi:hypothetical protein